MIGIYKITNTVNGKVYIGQSTDITRRWRQHKNSSLDYPLYNAFRKYGVSNFLFEVIQECEIDKLNELEVHYIKEYNSTNKNFGYNQASGGSNGGHGICFSCDTIQALFADLEDNILSKDELAIKYGCTERTIRDINNGNIWHQANMHYPIRNYFIGKDNKKHWSRQANTNLKLSFCLDCGIKISAGCVRCVECSHKKQYRVPHPTKEELIELIKNNSFVAIGKQFGVSDSTIRKWCYKYEIPIK